MSREGSRPVLAWTTSDLAIGAGLTWLKLTSRDDHTLMTRIRGADNLGAVAGLLRTAAERAGEKFRDIAADCRPVLTVDGDGEDVFVREPATGLSHRLPHGVLCDLQRWLAYASGTPMLAKNPGDIVGASARCTAEGLELALFGRSGTRCVVHDPQRLQQALVRATAGEWLMDERPFFTSAGALTIKSHPPLHYDFSVNGHGWLARASRASMAQLHHTIGLALEGSVARFSD